MRRFDATNIQYISHRGEPIPHKTRNFFAPPPDEIGTLISAWSTLKYWQRPKGNIALQGKIVLIAFFLWLVFTVYNPLNLPPTLPRFGFTILVAVVGTLIAIRWLDKPTPASCSYVGKEGFAEYVWDGRSPPLEKVFCAFDEVSFILLEGAIHERYDETALLEMSTVWVYRNSDGSYTNKGIQEVSEDTPVADAWHVFDIKAREIWIRRILPAMRKEIEEGKTVEFFNPFGLLMVGLNVGGIVLPHENYNVELTFFDMRDYTFTGGRLFIDFENPESAIAQEIIAEGRHSYGNAVQIELSPMGNMQAFATLFVEFYTRSKRTQPKPRQSDDYFDDGLGD